LYNVITDQVTLYKNSINITGRTIVQNFQRRFPGHWPHFCECSLLA